MYKSMGPFTATLPVAEVKMLVDISDDGLQWKTEVGHQDPTHSGSTCCHFFLHTWHLLLTSLFYFSFLMSLLLMPPTRNSPSPVDINIIHSLLALKASAQHKLMAALLPLPVASLKRVSRHC
jgi:hypothetical protein